MQCSTGGDMKMAQLIMWRQRSEIGLSPNTIQKRFESGDDVEGMADLPIREMLDHLRREFPGAKESAGLLHWQSGEEALKATEAANCHFPSHYRSTVISPLKFTTRPSMVSTVAIHTRTPC